MARFGFLLVALCFQPHVRADDVDSDVLSLLQMRAVVEDDQNNSVACHCTTPGQGTSGKNKYECNNGNSGYCASNQVCYADGNFNYGDWGAACALPTCKCVTPNAGTAGHNQYTCNDGTSAFCSSNQECYATGAFQKGNWQLGCKLPNSPAANAVDNNASPIKSRHDHADKCLDYHQDNNNVYMSDCHTGSNQKWYMDSERMKTDYDNKCLDMNLNDNNVYMHACHSGSNQQWFFDGEDLKTRAAPSQCLDYNYNNGNIYMHKCHGSSNQQFYYAHPANAARASKVKSKSSSNCMELDDDDNIHFNLCTDTNNQKFYLDGWKLKSFFSDKCADYNYGNDNVYMHACNAGSNQKWYFEGYYLKTNYNDKCLDLHQENANVYMHNCHSGSNQQFYLESVMQDLEHENVQDEIEQEKTKERTCKDWCYSKKHASKPWEGKKCAWKSCAGCSECP